MKRMERLLFLVVCFAVSQYTSAQDEKRSPVIYPDPSGNDCSMVDADIMTQGRIIVTPEGPTIIMFRMPKDWIPGEYICTWKIIAVANESNSDLNYDLGLKMEFTSRMNWDGDQRRVLGDVSISVPRLQFSFESFRFERIMYRDEAYNAPNEVLLELRIKVEENDNFNDENTFFLHINVDSPPVLPLRFKVSEIIERKGPRRSVKDFQFSWIDARRFCQRESEGMDLCSTNTLHTCMGRVFFSHDSLEPPIQYFPVLVYNHWATVTANTSECSTSQSTTGGPPLWGIEKSCPNEGCESKSYIYCCPENVEIDSYFRAEPYNLQPKPLRLYVTSGRNATGHFHYKFPDRPYNYDDDHDYYYDDSSSEDHWKTIGRIQGDITSFQIYSSYSIRSRTTVYFCGKEAITRWGVNVKYMVSLEPCKEPWRYITYAYAHKKPRGMLRKLYFGQSPTGDGTRISLTPPCCGYDDPGKNFVLYAIVRGAWEAKLPDRFCMAKKEYTEPRGTITSDKDMKKNYETPLHCSWTIKVREGFGVMIKYTYEPEAYWPCGTQDHIIFSNPDSERVYGRVCEKSEAYFLADSNIVKIDLVLEDDRAKFSVKYMEVKSTAPVPIKFDVDGEIATWEYARNFCSDKKLQLCTEADLCPLNVPPDSVHSNSRFLPVGDVANTWIAGSQGENDIVKSCNTYTSRFGPPDWGMSSLIMKNATHINRDEVFCCDREPTVLPVPKPVPVIVGYHNRVGEFYWFKRSEEWESPSYKFDYDDPYHYVGTTVYPWKPPSTFSNSPPNTVDFFSMSDHYEEGTFDQVVYFCRARTNVKMTPFEKNHLISIEPCDAFDWYYDFHLYAGTRKSEEAAFELHVGNISLNSGFSCCEKNAFNFTVFVIGLGQVPDTYVHRLANDTDHEYDFSY